MLAAEHRISMSFRVLVYFSLSPCKLFCIPYISASLQLAPLWAFAEQFYLRGSSPGILRGSSQQASAPKEAPRKEPSWPRAILNSAHNDTLKFVCAGQWCLVFIHTVTFLVCIARENIGLRVQVCDLLPMYLPINPITTTSHKGERLCQKW